MSVSLLARSAVAGAATGLRTTAALGALVIADAPGLPAPMRGDRAPLVAGLAVAGELVVDKLPMTPSRLEARGLAGRVVAAGLAGAVLARGARESALPAVLVAAAAAVAAARVGHDARAALAERANPFAIAAAEDGVALVLAGAIPRISPG